MPAVSWPHPAHIYGPVMNPCVLATGGWTKALDLELVSEPRQADCQVGGRGTCSFSLGSIGCGNPGSRAKDGGPDLQTQWSRPHEVRTMLGHLSYRGPATSLALAVTGRERLKVGQAERTAVSKVVGSRGCKRKKPEISFQGDRCTWWKVHGDKQT